MPVARNKEPRQFMPADFEASDRIIALSRSEHFPIVNERYPERLTRFEFWEAEDLHLEDPIVATDLIAAEVQALVKSLA